jgi:ADP-heptose:LPS heptosyltransferase
MKILIVRLSSMGDVALCVPVIQSLLKKYPDLELSFLTKKAFAPIVEIIPNLKIQIADTNGRHTGLGGIIRLFKELNRKEKFDWVVDLHNVMRSEILCKLFDWFSNAQIARYEKDRFGRKGFTRLENKNRTPLVHTSEGYRRVFASIGLDFELSYPIEAENLNPSTKRKIGFAPIASNPQKTWPLHKSRELLEILNKHEIAVELYGGPDEQEWLKTLEKDFQWVNRVQVGSLKQEIQSMQELELMISMDSANMHIAAIQGIRTLSIWGATHPDAGFAPLGKGHVYAQVAVEELDCRPCSVFGSKTCFRKDWACLNILNADTVAQQVIEMLAQKPSTV